jgi:hypothetical protein
MARFGAAMFSQVTVPHGGALVRPSSVMYSLGSVMQCMALVRRVRVMFSVVKLRVGSALLCLGTVRRSKIPYW